MSEFVRLLGLAMASKRETNHDNANAMTDIDNPH
jgi:hypothetical protein